jgi:Transposase DDE domain
VKLGHVALDGTKIKANASKHKAMSYERMCKREAELQAEVDGWLKAAEAADTAQDKAFGADKRGDEMPDWVADKQARLTRLRQAKAELEAEARAKAAAEPAARKKEDDKPRPGRTARPPSDVPEPKAQRNFTDPESRILKTKDGYIQGYNAQAAVDAKAQIIVAHTLTNNGSDQAQFAPLLDGIKANLKRNPDEVSADAGYCSAANLRTLSRRRIKGYIATGRQKHGTKAATAKRSAKPGSLLARMTIRLRRAGHRSRYRLRKQVVEPVFGQIKQARGFRQFLLRGIEKVKAEWAMLCTVHNLRKLASAAA